MAYPYEDFPADRSTGDINHISVHNQLESALNDLKAVLGLDPSASFADVQARLEDIEDSVSAASAAVAVFETTLDTLDATVTSLDTAVDTLDTTVDALSATVAALDTDYVNEEDHTKAAHDALAIDHGSMTGLADDDHSQYLLKAGGTMSGAIALDGNKVTGAGAATANGDLLRYEQLIGVYLLLAGGTMAGNIAMDGNKVTGLAAATTNGDAVRYEQALLLAGGTMTGALTLSGAPSQDLHAATKLYVDTNAGGAGTIDDGLLFMVMGA